MAGRQIRAGAAFVEIGIKNRLAAGIRGVQSDLKRIGQQAKALGTVLTGVGLAMGTPFAFAANKFASFDDAIRSVAAVTGATGDKFDMLRNKALELGRTTSFTAVEVASLMTELGRAGFSPDEIEAMTQAVLDLSRATGTEAQLSAGIMAASLRQFGLGADQATNAADALTAAANKSFNTVEALGEAMQYAGPVAADMGMSFEETLAILGTLGNIGIQGSAAGTALRRLATLSGAEADKLQEIFGVAFTDAAGNTRPLVDALEDVATATNDLPTAERAKKFNEAFGLLGITGASAIAKTAASTRDLLSEIEAAGGIASSTAQKMDAGLGGSFRKIMSAVEGVQIAVGDAFAPALKVVTDAVTVLLGPMTEWIGNNKELVTTVALAIAGVGAAGIALLGIGATLAVASSAVGGFLSAFSAIAFLVSPTSIAIGAIAGLGYAILEYTTLGVDSINWLKEKFGPLVETVQNAVRTIMQLISEGDIDGAWELTTDLMESVWLELTGVVKDVWGEAMGYVLDAGSSTAIGIGKAFQSLSGVLKGMLDAYRSYYDSVFNFVTEKIGNASGVRTIGGSGGGNSAFDSQFGGMVSQIESAIEGVRQFGENMEGEGQAQIDNRMAQREEQRRQRAEERQKMRDAINKRAKDISGVVADDDGKGPPEKDGSGKPKGPGGFSLGSAAAQAGPSATFDAFAASIIGMGPRLENESLKAQQATAKNTEAIARQAKKNNVARFAE